MGKKLTLKVLTYNIHKGFSADKRRYVLGEIKEALRSFPVDVICLQEVLGKHASHSKRIESWPELGQTHFLAELMGPHFSYGKNAVYRQGHHGNAILSRFPLLDSLNIDISTNPFEQRGCLHAIVELPGKRPPLHCFCVHLDLLHRGRSRQILKICKRIREMVKEDEPLLLAGDFNDWREQATPIIEAETGARELFHAIQGRHAVTFPSRFPLLRLDRIYARGITPLTCKVLASPPWNTLSDHVALLGEFQV